MALTKVGKEGITGVSNSSDATAITIDSSERVGIGITPDTTSNGKSLQINRSVINDDDGGSTHITQNGYYNSAWKYVEDGTAEKISFVSGTIRFDNASSNSSGADASLSWSERMRVSSSGFVGINTTSPVNQLHVNNSGNEVFCLERSGKSSGSGFAGFNIEGNSQLTICYDDGSNYVIGTASNPSTQAGFTQRFKLASNGNCNIPGVYSNTTSNSANVACHYSSGDLQRSTSSRRYKNTIKDLDVGLAELNKLRTVSFKGNNDGDIIFNGLIAEEVHDVGLTQFVEYDDENRPDGLRYPHMISICVKAIQELSTKVDDLEKKNDALEARIKKLEGG